MRRSIIVEATARLVFHSALVLSLFLLFAGHNQPGGGFVGGLVAAAAVAVHYLAGGIAGVREVVRLRPWTVLGGGLLLAAATALVPLVGGGEVLESAKATLDVPALGEVKATSTLVFEIGVYAVVLGLVLMTFEAFGEPVEGGDG